MEDKVHKISSKSKTLISKEINETRERKKKPSKSNKLGVPERQKRENKEGKRKG